MSISIRAAAIDIGFDIVKVAYPNAGGLSTSVFPAIAALVPDGPAFVAGLDGLTVQVSGLRFFVGPDAQCCQGGTETKPWHGDYMHSAQYRALMIGGLSILAKGVGAKPGDEVEVASLTLGLRLNKFQEERGRLVDAWTGAFDVPLKDGSVRVHIKKISAVPQPLGALFHYAGGTSGVAAENGSTSLVREINESNILVLDAGSSAFSYLATQGGAYVDWEISGSSPHGMEECARAVAKTFGGNAADSWQANPHVMRKIDKAIAERQPIALPSGQTVNFEEYWPAVRHVVDQGLDSMMRNLQQLQHFRRVLVTGGGAPFHAQRLGERFPAMAGRVKAMKNPTLANVLGFYAKAELHAAHELQA